MEVIAAYKEWVKKDMALLSLLIATLFDDATEHVIKCKTSHKAWTCLQENFASILVIRVKQLKAKLHTPKKVDEIEEYQGLVSFCR